MITLDAIAKTYAVAGQRMVALQGISLSVGRGEIFGIVGHSGAGKSTLVRCLALLERPESGRIWLAGEELTRLDAKALRAARRRIGLVFQHFNLLETASIFDNVALPLRLMGEPGASIKRRVQQALALVHLDEQAHKYPSQLSGGQKQRVGIARALVHKPEVLLLDEATSALDPIATESILRLVERIWRETRITTVLITHEMHVVQSLCHKVAVLHAGQLVEMGPVEQVLLRPVHAVTQKLVGHTSAITLPDAMAARYERLDAPARAQLLIVRVRVQGEAVQTPWMTDCSQHSGASLTLLRGTVDHVRQTAYGQLLLEIAGDAACAQRAIAYLEQRGFGVERVP